MEKRVLVRLSEQEQARNSFLFEVWNHRHLMREVFNMGVAKFDVRLAIYAIFVVNDHVLNLFPEPVALISCLSEIINNILEATVLQMLVFKNNQLVGDGLPDFRLVLIGEAELIKASTHWLRNDVDRGVFHQLDKLLDRLHREVFALDFDDGTDVELCLLRLEVLDFWKICHGDGLR